MNRIRSTGQWLLAPIVLGVVFLAWEATSPAESDFNAVSVGHANEGGLLHGLRLPNHGTGYLSRPSRNGYDGKFGTEELVSAIQKAAAYVERRAPGALLFVGDMSNEAGGRLGGHESHQAGRDVDLIFYVVDESGAVARPRGSVFSDRGRAAEADAGAGVIFDARRNWLVLRALIENEDAHLQRALVSEGLRSILLEYARDAHEPDWIIERASEAMCDSWSPHADHFHIRLYCTVEDYRRGCRDEYPVYPWRRTELAAGGILNPIIEVDPNRTGARARRWLRRPRLRTWCP